MASKDSNGSAFNLKGLSGLSLSSTISKDNMKGQQARNAQLLKEFGQKNQTPSLRLGLNAKGQQSGDVENQGSVLPTNVEGYGDEPEEYEYEEEEEESDEDGGDDDEFRDEFRAAIAIDVNTLRQARRHSGWQAQISVQERYEHAYSLRHYIISRYPDLLPEVVRSGVLSFEKAALEGSLRMETYEKRVTDVSGIEQHFRKHVAKNFGGMLPLSR